MSGPAAKEPPRITAIPTRIVSEISTEPDNIVGPIFEEEINKMRLNGFELESWQMHNWSMAIDEDEHQSYFTTIVAVFVERK